MSHPSSCRCFPIMTALLAAFLVNGLQLAKAAGDAEAADASQTGELSVAPSSHREFPQERPEWVETLESRDGDVDRRTVTSIPCRSEALCKESLQVSMRATVETYIESITGVEESSSIVTFDDQWIDRHRDGSRFYLGTVTTGDEVMYESATVLAFDADDRHLIQQRWRRHQVGQRLAVLGAMSGFGMTALIGIAATLSVVTRRAEKRVAG